MPSWPPFWDHAPRQVPAYRRMLAHITPGRDQARFQFTQTLDLTRTLPWLDAWNATHDRKMSLLVLYLTAFGRIMHLRPHLNGYVTRHRFFARDGVTLSVSVKKRLREGAKIVLLKLPVLRDDQPLDVLERLEGMLRQGRGDADLAQEKEHKALLRIPDFLLAWVIRFGMWLDRWRLMPAFLADPDPLFTSAVVANLGSVGLDAGHHHLYEWGNASYFVTIGRVFEAPVMRDGAVVGCKLVRIMYSFDERVADGVAAAIGMAGIKRLVEDPELFSAGIEMGDEPPESVTA